MTISEETRKPEAKRIDLGVVDVAAMREAAEAAAQTPHISADVVKRRPAASGAGWRARIAERLFYRPVARALARTNIRFVKSNFPNRIGHLAAELDYLLKEIELGERPKMRPVFVVRKSDAANAALLDLWSTRVTVISNPIAVRLLAPFLAQEQATHFITEPFLAMRKASPYPALLGRWGDRPPLLTLTDEMRAEGRAALARWGMPADGWFVCVHNREVGYAPEDDALHAHRNASIKNYRLAMEEIVAQGGFVVRMGDPTMRRLPAMDGVYDYAHSDERKPALDIFLAAECRFFLGTTSGLSSVATLFNRPVAMANAAPCGMALGVGPGDVAIPKLHKSADGRTFRFVELFSKGASRFRSAQLYRDAGIMLEENTPEDIRDLVIEMIERDEGRFAPTEDDRVLQSTFRRFVGREDYTFGAAGQVGRAFLRKHAMFL